jgi:hypothetical protein
MLRPRVSLGDQFTILVTIVEVVAWLLSLVVCIIVAVFRFGGACSRRYWAAVGPAPEGRGPEDHK